MPGPRLARRRLALAVVVALPLFASIAITPAQAATGPVAHPTHAASRTAASAALVRAERLLSPSAAGDAADSSAYRRAPGTPAEGVRARRRGDLTLALRDLAVRRADLPASQQQRAARLLSRPATDSAVSNDAVIVHYNAAEASATDAQTTLAVVTQVREAYLAGGYRAPKSDGVAGGDARFDVYLDDLVSTSAYGYCTSDQPTGSGQGRSDRWAFCVLDEDFQGYAGDSTPAQLRQVTVAHEYFHAVQFAYDATEDGWFMEGTAVWMEDELFTDVNDNMQYAAYSPLARPRASLDVFAESGYRQYGSWLFFRWLSERFPEEQGGLPTIIRDFWEAADSTSGNAARKYSLNAIAGVLKQRGLPLARAFALFADANRRPAQTYAEGAANSYPTASPRSTLVLAGSGASGARSYRLDHLASATTRFVPRRQRGAAARLRVVVDMAPKSRGSVAVVSTIGKDGGVMTQVVRLNARGDGRLSTPFSTRSVSGVEVTLANASKRFAGCYTVSNKFSCFGRPLDQDLTETVRVSVLR